MPRLLCFLALILSSHWSPAAGLTLREALGKPGVQIAISAASRDTSTVTITNGSAEDILIDQPAGLICTATSGETRMAILSRTQIPVVAQKTVEIQVSIVALSAGADPTGNAFAPSDPDPSLAPLLTQLTKNPALPQPAAQIAVLCWREDVTFAQWQQFLASSRPPSAGPATVTPAEIAGAIDALTLLRALAPERAFALATDGELKLRALRNPWSREKAMQLYGLTLPDAAAPAPVAAAGGVAPELRTLLHLSPGDNCPTCRQRTLLQPRDDGL